MDYFNILPKATVAGVDLVDISRGVVLLNKLDRYLVDYSMRDDQSLNDVSYEIYNDDQYYWLLNLVNPGILFKRFKTTSQMQRMIEEKYTNTVLQLEANFNALPATKSKIALRAFDIDGNEIKITNIDYSRKQIHLDTKILTGISLTYYYENMPASLDQYFEGEMYFQEGYMDTSYTDDTGTYYYYVAEPSGTVGIPAAAFTAMPHNEAAAYYWHQGIRYETVPRLIDPRITRMQTFEDHWYSENDKLRMIKAVDPKFLSLAIRDIEDFAKSFKELQLKARV
jgi:hypothetical protein